MKMLKIPMLAVILACGGSVAYPQSGNPKLLDASHCLATAKQDWLGVEKSHAKTLELGYVIDTNSDPGVNHIYIVAYSSRERSKGKVFDVIYRQKGRKTSIDVQNNGSFIRSGTNIVFTEPVLGGTWTETHLQSAIKLAGQRPSITVTTVDLEAPSVRVTCESYADNGK